MNPVSAASEIEEVEGSKQSVQATRTRSIAPDRAGRMSVVVIDDIAALDRYVAQWDELAAAAIEPNPFYESWMLLPALRAYGAGKDVRVILILAPNPARPQAEPVLCGLFPIERQRYKGMPVSVLTLWKHLFCFLCTPLVRRDRARECMKTFFDWLATEEAGAPLVEFLRVAGEGPFHQLLVDELHDRELLAFSSELYTRATLVPASDGEAYLQAAISGPHRKELRRKQTRLAETGDLTFEELQPDGALDTFIEEFMQLEMAGWKGKLGGALDSNPENHMFFTTVAREAFYRGRLMMLAARVDGKPVAMKCNFLAGEGSFAFKIAYDEAFSYYSPGLLLELDNIRRIHARPEIKWMDSCAIPAHAMINRLWLDRRTIQTLLVPTRRGLGEFVVSVMPMVRWANRKVRALVLPKRRAKAEDMDK
jgi:CelD/BcsL family acetyltransferase involved in cellulose biosynthesis